MGLDLRSLGIFKRTLRIVASHWRNSSQAGQAAGEANKRDWGGGKAGYKVDQPMAIVTRNSALVLTFFNRLFISSMASTTFISLKTFRRR